MGASIVVDSMNVESNSTPHEIQSANPSDIVGLKRKPTSDVWIHFKRQNIDGKWKAVCNYCGSKLLGKLKQGTSHLRNHFHSCKLRTTRDIRQAFIKTEKVGNQTVIVDSYAFTQDIARRAVSKMIILHEYPLAMVDHIGFKEFCATLQPLFKVVSRNTVKANIMKMYKDEKESMMKLLSKNQSRIAITTDMWTASNQNKSYMTVTTHFIDDSWTLQGRLVRVRRSLHKRASTRKGVPSGKSELDQYLEEQVLPASDNFDILGWWKASGLKYPILQMIVRDFLAIPISTVASESSFSTSGRVVTPHRSRLHSYTLETLMCVQDWLRTDVKGSSKLKNDIIEFNKVLEDTDGDVEPGGQSCVTEVVDT